MVAEQLVKVAAGERNVIAEAAGGSLRLKPLSTAQYDEMIEAGVLLDDHRFELLDGLVVAKDRGDAGGDPMTVGALHSYVVRQLAYLGLRLDPEHRHLQTQQPVVIPEDGEPEPDAAIVERPLSSEGKARASEISCVIEVSGTSLARDRTTKLRHYAQGGIPQYVIVDLSTGGAEEYLHPDPVARTYDPPVHHPAGSSVRLRLGGGKSLELDLDELFPGSRR